MELNLNTIITVIFILLVIYILFCDNNKKGEYMQDVSQTNTPNCIETQIADVLIYIGVGISSVAQIINAQSTDVSDSDKIKLNNAAGDAMDTISEFLDVMCVSSSSPTSEDLLQASANQIISNDVNSQGTLAALQTVSTTAAADDVMAHYIMSDILGTKYTQLEVLIKGYPTEYRGKATTYINKIWTGMETMNTIINKYIDTDAINAAYASA